MKESTITYQALSRGYYLNVEIQGNKINMQQERESVGREFNLSEDDFREISNLYDKISLNEIESYKGPTEKRFYDGAAIANLRINYQGKIYSSQDFDHGNPPVQIAEFINKIVSLSANK